MLTALLSLLVTTASVAEPQWIGPTPPTSVVGRPEPRWLWVVAADQPAPSPKNAPAGTVYLSRSFDGPRGGASAVLALAADNEATAYLNGVEVLASSDWSSPVLATITLREGPNLVTIRARNGSVPGQPPETAVNPAGVVARLITRGDQDETVLLMTDSTWKGATQPWPGFPWAPPPESAGPVVDLGPCSTPPWAIKSGAFDLAPPCPVLRKTFVLPEPPTTARIRIIGLGHYELRCNGVLVSDTVINQSWSQYNKTLYSQDFDLTPHLRAGENVLAVSLGNSFWSVGPVNDARRFSKTDAMPDFSEGWPYLLWVDATIAASSGNTHIVSDGSWRWSSGPVTFSHIYAGEDFDARLAMPGWDAPGFDDSAWSAPATAPAPAGKPTPLDGPGLQAFRTFDPAEIKTVDSDAGIYTYVFPQNCSAIPRFTLDGGRAGNRVRFRPCEYMQPDGRVKFTYTWGTGKDIWLDYTKRGGGPETHQPLFFYAGAQFVQVEGAVPEGLPNPGGLPVLKALRLIHVRAACPQVGEFECSSPMHNAAHSLIDWSIRSNMSYVPTDCPHREKNGWIEQDWHMARAMSYRFGVREYLAKTLRDIRDTQLPDGHVPTNSPNYLVGVPPHGFWNEAPEWGIASVLVPWHLYEWYGDKQVLVDNYDSAKRYVDYLSGIAKDGVITSNLGDWYDFGHGKGNGPSQWTPQEVSATAIRAYGIKTMGQMAEALNRTEDARAYRDQFLALRETFRNSFYDPATHTVKHNGSCQAGTAAAICIGLVPEEDVPAAAEAIVQDLMSRNWQQTTGEVLHVFLVRALAESGRGDALHHVYNREEVGSYGFMVKSGLTTLPESWDGRRGTGDSLNHFMLGHLMEWHYAYVAGIRQERGSVGWQRVLIAPQVPSPRDASPNAIRSARAATETPRGRVSSEWNIEGDTLAIRCEIPPGVEARLMLSDGSTRPLAAGVTAIRDRLPR